MKHLMELRYRVLALLIIFGLFLIVTYTFREWLYYHLSLPLVSVLSSTAQLPQLHAINVTSTFFVPLKVALFVAFLLTVPAIAYHLDRFMSPALYALEKKYVRYAMVAGTTLFYSGVILGYLIFLPIVFNFFYDLLPENTLLTADISLYFSFVMRMLILWGCIFEIPVILLYCIKMQIISRVQLISKRRWVILGAFLSAMLLTPPDILSQLLLAIPMIILFELSVWLSKYIEKDSNNETA